MKYYHYCTSVSDFNTKSGNIQNTEPWLSYTVGAGLTYSPAIDLISAANGYEYVDLGLPSGTLWAACNVGASSPDQAGGYYAWGETTTKNNYNWKSYQHGTGGSYNPTAIYKYNSTDNLVTLEPEDDVAHIVMGGKWRMPTVGEVQELVDETAASWKSINGVYGIFFYKDYNGPRLFIPHIGNYFNTTFDTTISSIWTSSLNPESNVCGASYALEFSAPGDGTCTKQVVNRARYYGFYVRGVLSVSRRWYNRPTTE